MRCLVTGAYGFIGREVVAALQGEGFTVIGAGRDLDFAARILPDIEWVACDFNRDVEALGAASQGYRRGGELRRCPARELARRRRPHPYRRDHRPVRGLRRRLRPAHRTCLRRERRGRRCDRLCEVEGQGRCGAGKARRQLADREALAHAGKLRLRQLSRLWRGLRRVASIAGIFAGALFLLPRWVRRAGVAQLILSTVYLVDLSVLAPELWTDHFGPLLKVVPMMAATIVDMAFQENR